jgi:hypothetical protein
MCGVNVFVFVSRHVNMEKKHNGKLYSIYYHIYSHKIILSYNYIII